MNVEELREIAETVVDDVQTTDVVNLLTQLRTAVSRQVNDARGSLGREFDDLETLIRPYIEADSGSPPPLEVRQIASTDFLAVVYMTPGAALLLSKAIDGVLAVYERVLRIRKLRQELN